MTEKTKRPSETMLAKVGITVEMIVDAVEADDCLGYCIECGADAYCVESDARRYPCESCGQRCVYGAEELLLHCVP